MAAYTSAQSGLFSAGSTWVGGVVPPSAALSKITIATGHTVTYDVADGRYGDETSTGITVNGVFKASRVASTKLTCQGDFLTNTGTTDWGSEADPIPDGITAEIVLNYSSAMAHNKWVMRTNTASAFAGFKVWGAQKTQYAQTTEYAAANATIIKISAVAGWKVGDLIVWEPPVRNRNYLRACAITAISAIAGGHQITLSNGLGGSDDFPIGTYLSNLTRNVRVYGYDQTNYKSLVLVAWSNGYVSQSIEIGDCAFILSGGGVPPAFGGLTLNGGVNTAKPGCIKALKRFVVTDVRSHDGAGATLAVSDSSGAPLTCFASQAEPFTIEQPLVACAGGAAVQIYSGSGAIFDRPVLYKSTFTCGYSQGSVGAKAILPIYIGSPRPFQGTGVTFAISSGVMVGSQRINDAGPTAFGAVEINGLEYRQMIFPASALVWATGAYNQDTYRNCTLQAGWAVARASANLNNVSPSHQTLLLSVNNDPTQNWRYTQGGQMTRDNAVFYRGLSSLRMDSWYSSTAHTYSYTISVGPGQTLVLPGYVRANALYGTTSPPSITISGLGIAPVTFTAPANTDVWNKFSLTATNPNSYAGEFTVTLTALSTANVENASVYWDGLINTPWIGAARHFGYQFTNTAVQLVEPRITLTEAAALALPVAVNHATSTITVSGPVSALDLWQACIADLCQTPNLARDVHATYSGGVVTTTYTVAFTGTGDVTGVYVDAAGTHVKITAAALIAGSRAQVYNVTDGIELYNGVLATTGLTLSATWTADKTIRLRAEHSTKLPLEAAGVLGSTGLAFLDLQQEDTVYADNGIDGATVTVLSADTGNIEIDINDLDGLLSVQEIYAWAQHYQTTAEGIASAFFGAVTATDVRNVLINVAKANIRLDNIGSLPIKVIGGTMTRSDGTTVIAAGSGSIQMDPGRAYQAPQVAADYAAIATAVRTNLAPELARVDVATSTRLATAGYTAPIPAPTAAANATAVRAELAPELARVDVATSTRLATAGYTAPTPAPTAAANATAVRAELAPELARVDVATSTRLATAGYTAPTPAPTAAANATAVRAELAPELARVDVATSTRLATAGYTAAPTAANNAEAVEAQLLPALASINANVSTRLAAADYVPNPPGDAPTAAEVATAVRAELGTELARVDVPVSTRLATAGYTAPTPAPTAAANAAAVRAELAPELARVDAPITTRATAADQVLPPTAEEAAAAVWAHPLAPAQAPGSAGALVQETATRTIGS